jgi:ribosomal protein S12 methylthiotransferase accessory factor
MDEGISGLKKAGLEPIVVDMTSIDAKACGLSVMKVIIPECELLEGDHRMPFLGGRRWLEVPVRLGLRSAPLRLEERNKQPHPYP